MVNIILIFLQCKFNKMGLIIDHLPVYSLAYITSYVKIVYRKCQSIVSILYILIAVNAKRQGEFTLTASYSMFVTSFYHSMPHKSLSFHDATDASFS